MWKLVWFWIAHVTRPGDGGCEFVSTRVREDCPPHLAQCQFARIKKEKTMVKKKKKSSSEEERPGDCIVKGCWLLLRGKRTESGFQDDSSCGWRIKWDFDKGLCTCKWREPFWNGSPSERQGIQRLDAIRRASLVARRSIFEPLLLHEHRIKLDHCRSSFIYFF